ncbi:MAG: hypothetical protein LBH19_01780 [Dysgonamonadaceae bacterium]|jgi:hypothetical protein|nr:hypothetical protein [Dysgonamonadaceae bacterium]
MFCSINNPKKEYEFSIYSACDRNTENFSWSLNGKNLKITFASFPMMPWDFTIKELNSSQVVWEYVSYYGFDGKVVKSIDTLKKIQ